MDPNEESSLRKRDKRKKELLHFLQQQPGPLSAAEVSAFFAGRGSLSWSRRTVFRYLEDMIAEGELVRVDFPGHPPCYEIPRGIHHPHMLCRQCNRIFCMPFETPSITVPMDIIPEGMEIDGEEWILFGTCRECREPESGATED